MSQRLLKLIVLVILVIWLRPASADDWGNIRFVESVPVETSLGVSQTARTLPVWLEMINSAQTSIDMEIFYLANKPGEALEPVVDALKAADARGVRVRIVADAKMARIYPETLDELDQLPHTAVRKISFYDAQGGVMHAKYFIVDEKELFLGSQNMDWRAITHIHELGVQVRDQKLAGLVTRVFDLDWEIAGMKEQKRPEVLPEIPPDRWIDREHLLTLAGPRDSTVRVYPTGSPDNVLPPVLARDETELVRLIDSAKTRVEIQLLSYHPVSHHQFYAVLDNALRRAAARGVQVRMIVSNWNTRQPGIRYLKSLQVVPNVEIKISSIPPWSGGFVSFARVEHCKYLVVDENRLWLGTSNWSYSYFHLSRNLGLVMQGKWANGVVHKVFEKSWNSPYCQTLDVCKEYQPPEVRGKDNK